jgi:iron(III) transport system permease protein
MFRLHASERGPAVLGLVIAIFLAAFLVLPVFRVIWVAFLDPSSGGFTLINFYDFFRNQLFIESFVNSVYVAIMAVVVASIIAMPLAYFTSRFNFAGSALIQALGFVPLIMPPFVGAVAMQLLFGANGSINLMLDQWFGWTIPFMEGLNGVIFVESLHYFPFILINLSAALQNIDRSLEESAQNLGASGLRLFRKIVLPLSMPGYVAGAALVFIKVFDDLGTPLLLNVNDMLAPQAYLRITAVGISDPMGYVISVILVVFSALSLWISLSTMRHKDYASVQKGGGGLMKRDLGVMEKFGAYSIIVLLLTLVLSPHLGLLLLSFGTIWSYAVLPDAYTLAHYATVFETALHYVTNTVIYAGIAGVADVVIGVAIAYVVLRTNLAGRKWLDYIATASLAIPGVVLGIGYLRSFHDYAIPGVTDSVATWWVTIIIALTIRRLPYALRACLAALQQVSQSLEEAAENLGANKRQTVRRVVLPLMLGGILAGFVTSCATAAVELSTTIMLVAKSSDAPLAYGIYEFMQTPAGRGPGAALGVLAVVLVGIGTYLSHLVINRGRSEQQTMAGQH